MLFALLDTRGVWCSSVQVIC